MPLATQFEHRNVVASTLRRYGMSLGHSVLVLVISTSVFLIGRSYAHVAWGLLAAEGCLLGFWAALADRPLGSRIAFGTLHLFGLFYCVLLAGALHIDSLRAGYDLIDVLRDVVPMFAGSFVFGTYLRHRGWRLMETSEPDATADAMRLGNRQFSLGEFVKWFTVLCIALGVAGSLAALIPTTAILFDEWVWRSRLANYAEFLLGVALPMAVSTTLAFWLILAWREIRPRACATALGIWAMVASLWIGLVICAPSLLAAYYSWRFAHLPSVAIPTPSPDISVVTYGLGFDFTWSLCAFAFSACVALASATLSGWRVTRTTQLK